MRNGYELSLLLLYLYSYIYKISREIDDTAPGTRWPDPSNIIIPLLDSSFRQRVVWLRTFSDQPGLIYYQEVRLKEAKAQYASSMATVKDQQGNEYEVVAEDKERGLVLVAAGGVFIIGVLASNIVSFGATVPADAASIAAGLALIEYGLALEYASGN